MAKAGKRYRALREKTATDTVYSLSDAVALVKKNANTKFDETVDIALNLGVDAKQSDQSVRGMVSMPNGLGKTIRVAVFARGDKAEDAKKAGADLIGAEDLGEKIEKGETGFDIVIAAPDMMAVVGKLGKVLGPMGKMPNPKLGTVTPNVGEAVKKAKAGQVEFRIDKAGIIHAGVGKVSFDQKAVEENIKALVSAVVKAKPSGVKGHYIKKVTLSSTMGVGVKVDLSTVEAA